MKIILKLSIIALAVGTILAGCATCPQHTHVWEYKTVAGAIFGDGDTLTAAINREIDQGWQFVSSGGVGDRSGFAVLKREKKRG